MKKRELLEIIEAQSAIINAQADRLRSDAETDKKFAEILQTPKLKTLDQSVFDGQDEKFRFAVSNHRGLVFLSDTEPKQHHLFSGWCFDGSYRAKALLGGHVFGDATNWQNSLIEREAKPLSGNERIKRLLEKQKLVIVKCSDVSYEDAQEGGDWDVCLRYANDETDYQIENGCHAWRYGIPYDQYGNEILDVE